MSTSTLLDQASGDHADVGDELEAFFDSLPRRRSALLLWVLTHPARIVHAHRLLGRLAVLQATPSTTVDGRALAVGLSRHSAMGRMLARGATCVLPVPATRGEYSAGTSRKTVCKKRNGAVRAGVRWEAVGRDGERRLLLELANERERTHPDERYRTAEPDNTDLLELSHWWVARGVDGRPLLLAVAAVDGDWALLRYFRMLAQDAEATLARFLMSEVMVDELGAVGVRHLATDMSPIRMSRGLRAFQHQVGFELRRVRSTQ